MERFYHSTSINLENVNFNAILRPRHLKQDAHLPASPEKRPDSEVAKQRINPLKRGARVIADSEGTYEQRLAAPKQSGKALREVSRY